MYSLAKFLALRRVGAVLDMDVPPHGTDIRTLGAMRSWSVGRAAGRYETPAGVMEDFFGPTADSRGMLLSRRARASLWVATRLTIVAKAETMNKILIGNESYSLCSNGRTLAIGESLEPLFLCDI